jgi:hypothetical protein
MAIVSTICLWPIFACYLRQLLADFCLSRPVETDIVATIQPQNFQPLRNAPPLLRSVTLTPQKERLHVDTPSALPACIAVVRRLPVFAPYQLLYRARKRA